MYRVWVPKGRKLTARVSGNAATTLTLARTTTQSVVPSVSPSDRLARGTQDRERHHARRIAPRPPGRFRVAGRSPRRHAGDDDHTRCRSPTR